MNKTYAGPLKKTIPQTEAPKEIVVQTGALKKSVTPAAAPRNSVTSAVALKKNVNSAEARGFMPSAATVFQTITTKKCLLSIAAALIVVIVACLCMAGSSGEANSGLIQIVGKVTSDGQPIHSGTVTLVPETAKGNTSRHLPTGLIDDYGNYEVFTTGKPGASPGWYKVLVFALVEERRPLRPGQFPVMKSLVPPKYSDPKSTELSIEVTDTREPLSHDLNLKK